MIQGILRIIVPPFVSLFVKEKKGMRNIPKGQAFIVTANHESYMDHLVIKSTIDSYLNRTLHYLAKKEHFEKYIERKWHQAIGAIPIDRDEGGKEALAWALKALHQGKIIGVYPEGTRSLNGKMNKAKTGAIRLALQAEVPILPIGLHGCFALMPKGKHFPKLNFHSVTMHIGEPIYFTKYYGKENDAEVLRKLTTKLMQEIAKLAKTTYPYE